MAQASSGRSLLSLRAPAVWLVSLLSSSVAAASMVVNDYFDFRSGADVVNAPQKVGCAANAQQQFVCGIPAACQCATHLSYSFTMRCSVVLQPLPSGMVPPDGALLLSFVLYVGVLLATCFMVRMCALSIVCPTISGQIAAQDCVID